MLEVRNPSYPPDEFTDRWPRNVGEQQILLNDLRHLKSQLLRLEQNDISLTNMKSILHDLFGETAANVAVANYLEEGRVAAERGEMRFGPAGRVLTGAAAIAAASASTAARASTPMGGPCIPD
jgi:hypothetical protein